MVILSHTLPSGLKGLIDILCYPNDLENFSTYCYEYKQQYKSNICKISPSVVKFTSSIARYWTNIKYRHTLTSGDLDLCLTMFQWSLK